MNAIGLVTRAGPADLRNIYRDPLLRWTLMLPPIVALMFRWGVPALGTWLRSQMSFELPPYYPLIAGSYVLVAPSIIGLIAGFLLLDERDERILDAIRVTPVSIHSLLAYRIGVPLILGTIVTVVTYPWIDLVPLPLASLLSSATLAAGSGPLLALVLMSFADNKVSGFAIAKLFSAVSNLALVAWFLPMPWQVAAGVVPSYWPMKVIWATADGTGWLTYAAAGTVLTAIALALLIRRLRTVLSA